MSDYEMDELHAEIDRYEEERKMMSAEIRRLHGVCRELEAELRSRTMWVVIRSLDQSSFTDYESADPAEPDRQIMGIFSSEEKARELQEELINQNAHEVICFDADEIDVTIEEMEIQ